jgi:Tfp pilus assembly protein PilF
MRIFLRAGGLCLAIAILVSARLQASDHGWLQVRSPHFRVITDAGAKRGLEVAARCEQMRVAFLVLMAKASANDPAPLLIFALKSQKEVDELAQNRGRKLRHAGIFFPGSDESFILVDVSGDPWHTVFHEYAHELLHANTPASVQTWFEEGFADYFSTLNVHSDRTEIGQIPIGELQFLRQNGKLMRLPDLVRVDQNSTIYNQNGPLQAAFYAQSWLLVHYLFDHQLINRAQSFFSAISEGISLEQSTFDAFGMQSGTLEQELLSYARGEKFRYFSLPRMHAERSAALSVEQVSEIAASALILDVRRHAQFERNKSTAEEYAKEFRSLLSLDNSNPDVLRGLGVALFETEDYQNSLLYLRQAAQAEPGSPLNLHAMAELLNAMDSAGAQAEHAGVSLAQEVEVCAALDPHYADIYRLRASALARQGRLDEAAGFLRRAIALSPRMESYALDLADIELRKHDYAPALALLHQLQNSRNPKVVEKAEYFLSAQQTPLGRN